MKQVYYQFAALMLAYSFVWLPIVYAYAWLAQKGNKDANDAHVPPPRFVWVSILFIFGLFLLFPWAYAKNLVRDLPKNARELVKREKLYVLASMAAKVSLHAIIGFAVIGQSAALDAIRKEKNGTMILQHKPRDDNDTLVGIVAAVFSSIAVLSILTYLAVRIKDPVTALRRLHILAAVVHIVSASVILSVALAETNGSLKRYNAKPDLSHFLKPERWQLKCYNTTTKVVHPESVAKCSDGLEDVFINNHRGKGWLNIAVLAFLFAFWSGICHVRSISLVDSAQWANVDAVGFSMAKWRWFDYGLSAPLMLLTLNVIFAATNWAGVILAPLLLFTLEVFAAVIELKLFNPLPFWMVNTLYFRLML